MTVHQKKNGRDRYLFVRIIEACNAGCFFCKFAHSKDLFRVTLDQMRLISEEAVRQGIGTIRFTGGEPLIHRDIIQLVRICGEDDHNVSIITNGTQLVRLGDELIAAGLNQVIVSLDSPFGAKHNEYRSTPRLFERAVKGIQHVQGRIAIRVNTVVGPHNFQDMPQMQRFLEDLGVGQWELSPLKSHPMPKYEDPCKVVKQCREIYDNNRRDALIPLGPPFYGQTVENQQQFFESGITPRPQGRRCNVTDKVHYLDLKNRKQFACSPLAHRDLGPLSYGDIEVREDLISLDTETFQQHKEHYALTGPTTCVGCSTTAAGFSDLIEAGSVSDWSY